MSLNERKIRNNTTGQMHTKVTGDCSHHHSVTQREELRKEWQIIRQVSWFTEWRSWDQRKKIRTPMQQNGTC